MGEVRKISIAITAEQLADIEAAVERGDYVTNSEVIRDALRGWQYSEKARELETARLRALWEEGIASGVGGVVDDAFWENIKIEGKRRLAELREGAQLKSSISIRPGMTCSKSISASPPTIDRPQIG